MAGVALMLAAHDVRVMTRGGLQGAARLKRHLGRMTGALFVATTSFFVGNPQVFAGGPLEPMAVRVVPVLAVVASIAYWRVRMAWRPLTAAA